MDLRERRQQAARREIVHAAYALFSEHGFSDTTVEMIAERSAVSPRTIYRYFTTKEAIVLGELDGEVDRIVARVREHCADGVSLAGVLAAFADQFAERQHDDWFPTLAALMRDNDQLMIKGDGWRRELAAGIAEALAELEGDAQPSFRHQAMAAAAVSMAATAVASWARADQEPDLPQLVHASHEAVVGPDRP